MLGSIDREQFDEWLAYRELEPDAVDRIILILKLGFSAVCNAWGAKLEPDDFDPFATRGNRGEAPVQEVSPQQAVAMVSTVLGAPN